MTIIWSFDWLISDIIENKQDDNLVRKKREIPLLPVGSNIILFWMHTPNAQDKLLFQWYTSSLKERKNTMKKNSKK